MKHRGVFFSPIIITYQVLCYIFILNFLCPSDGTLNGAPCHAKDRSLDKYEE